MVIITTAARFHGQVLAAAVRDIETFWVSVKSLQAKFGAEINDAALVFGGVIIFRRGGHAAPAHQSMARSGRYPIIRETIPAVTRIP